MENNFCNQPFEWRAVNLDQEWFKFCCVSPTYPITFDKLNSNPVLNNVKKNLWKNNQPKECSYCFDLERAGSTSYRTTVGRQDRDNFTNGLGVLEINLENTCNLRCAMCGPKFSSRWESLKILGDTRTIPIKITSRDRLLENLDHVIELIATHQKTLNRIFISGGEPSMIPNFYRLIDSIIEDLPTKVSVVINTNGMFNDRLGEKFISTIGKISQTHNVMLYWSCDGFGEVGEFLRNGLNYLEFKENLQRMQRETTAHHTIQITTTHMNLTSQIDMIEDIYRTMGPVPLKKLFAVIGDFMHPAILGNRILNVVTDNHLKRLQEIAPEYSIEYTKLVNQISKQQPNQNSINKCVDWFIEYAQATETVIPKNLQDHFNLISNE